MAQPRHLHAVDERDEVPAVLVDPATGQTFELRDRIQALEDQVKGAERDLNGWRTRHANLLRDKEAEAKDTDLWPAAVAVFDHWRTATGHKGSEWEMKRFEMIRPHLERSGTGKGRATKLTAELLARNVEICKLAIDGLAFDPFKTKGRNGRTITHDGLHLAFDNADLLEKRCKMAPVDRIAEVFPPRADPPPPPQTTLA